MDGEVWTVGCGQYRMYWVQFFWNLQCELSSWKVHFSCDFREVDDGGLGTGGLFLITQVGYDMVMSRNEK